jgi:hypothetical protein
VPQQLAGERANVCWITTEAIDRQRDVLLVSGIDKCHFVLNPLVTVNHKLRGPALRPVPLADEDSRWFDRRREGD